MATRVFTLDRVPNYYTWCCTFPTFTKQIVVSLSQNRDTLPPNLDTNEHIVQLLTPFFRNLDSKAKVTHNEQRNCSLRLHSKIKTDHLRDIISATLKFMNSGRKTREHSYELYDYQLLPYEESPSDPAVRTLQIDINKRRVVRTGSEEYQRSYYGYYINEENLSTRTHAYLTAHQATLPQDLNTPEGPLAVLGALYPHFDEQTKVFPVCVPKGLDNTLFVHTRLTGSGLSGITHAAISKYEEEQIKRGFKERYGSGLLRTWSCPDVLALKRVIIADLQKSTTLPCSYSHPARKFKDDFRRKTVSLPTETDNLQSIIRTYRTYFSEKRLKTVLEDSRSGWAGAHTALRGSIEQMKPKLTYEVSGAGLRRNENNLSIFTVTLKRKKLPDQNHYQALQGLRQGTVEYVRLNPALVPKDPSNLPHVKAFLLDTLKEHDPAVKMIGEKKGACMTVETVMDHLSLEEVLSSALLAACMNQDFPAGYQLNFKIIKSPDRRGNPYIHQIILERNDPADASLEQVQRASRAFFLQNAHRVAKALVHSDHIGPLLDDLLKFLGAPSSVRPVYMGGHIKPAIYIFTEHPLPIVKEVVAFLNAAKLFYTPHLEVLKEEDGDNCIILSYKDRSEEDKPLSFSDELDRVLKETSLFVNESDFSPENFTTPAELSALLGTIIAHIDRKATLAPAAGAAGELPSFTLRTKLTPNVSQHILDKALKTLYIRKNFPWGFEVGLKETAYCEGDHHYTMDLTLDKKEDTQEYLRDRLERMRHLLSANRYLIKAELNTYDKISRFLDIIFSRLNMKVSIACEEGAKRNKTTLHLHTEEDFDSLAPLLTAIFETYQLSQPAEKPMLKHKLAFLRKRRRLRGIDFDTIINRTKPLTTEELYEETNDNVYQLVVDAGENVVFGDDGEFAFNLVDPDEAGLAIAVHEDLIDMEYMQATLQAAYGAAYEGTLEIASRLWKNLT